MLVVGGSTATPGAVLLAGVAAVRAGAGKIQLATAAASAAALGVAVPEGSLYYERTRRRRSVTFDEPLRDLVRETTGAVRDLFSQPVLPAPAADSRCPNCSLLDACLPYAIADYRGDPALFEVGE